MQPQTQLNPDQVLSSLAFTNNIHKQQAQQENEMLAMQEGDTPTTPSETPQNDPGQQEDTSDIDTKLSEMEARLTEKIDALGEDNVASELEDIKRELKTLEENDTETTEN